MQKPRQRWKGGFAVSDFVDRQKLKEAIQEDALNNLLCYNGEVLDLVLTEIDEIPAADVVPVVHGEWIIGGVNGNRVIGNWKCSVCKGVSLKNTPFCPNCGCRMLGGDKDDPISDKQRD